MKYILELEDEPNKEYFGEGNYYRCKQIPYWSISESMRNRLEPYDEADEKERVMMDNNNFVTVAKESLMILEQKAKDSEYFRGRVDGMEYIIDAIEEAFKSKEGER